MNVTQTLRFPCAIAIKAMGRADPDFDALVVGIVRRHVADLNEGAVRTRTSGQGHYRAVTVTVRAQSRDQMDAIYRAPTSGSWSPFEAHSRATAHAARAPDPIDAGAGVLA
jgi:putative lipoic acid-binding regulatory protein